MNIAAVCTDSDDRLDRALVRATQAGLPLDPRPYLRLAEQLGTDEARVIARLQALQDAGAIRRIGLVPHHYRIGVQANAMSVWDVDDACIDEVGREVGALAFVSHCYRRPRRLPDWPYNLFAMVHGRDRNAVHAQVEQIAALLGVRAGQRDLLFSTAVLKKTGVRIG